MRLVRPDGCARAATGQDAAVSASEPPSSVMNSRRFIRSRPWRPVVQIAPAIGDVTTGQFCQPCELSFNHLVGAEWKPGRNLMTHRLRRVELMTSSNPVGCLTGRSAGLAPRSSDELSQIQQSHRRP
jgi:hypothetical protein